MISKYVGPISFGVVMGDYASKKLTKAVAGLVGVTFIGLQVLFISTKLISVRDSSFIGS